MSGGSLAGRPASVPLGPWSWRWVAAVAVGGVAVSGRVSPTLLLALGVVAGLPHGTADLDGGRRAFRSYGKQWWQPFLGVYLGLIAAVLLAWRLCPAATLVGFLFLSMIHFGRQDRQDRCRSLAWVVAQGAAPVIVPAVVHGGKVERLFAVLAGDGAPAIVAALSGPVSAVWCASIAVAFYQIGDSAERRSEAAELALVVLLFALTTPLVAFAFYFALLHTPRALVAQRIQGAGSSWASMTALTLLACALGAGIFVVAPGLTFDADVVRTAFMLLAALTVPHMALDHLERGGGAVA